MHYQNTLYSYGLISITLHWLMALLLVIVFVLGDWMVELDYYSAYYQIAPWWHKSLGFTIFGLLLIRFVWKIRSIPPKSLEKSWLRHVASLVHGLFYMIILVLCLSGYFISTAKGVGLDVFDVFTVPAMMTLNEDQVETVADVHEFTAWSFVGLVVLHAGAALKHHFVHKNRTLVRMLNPNLQGEEI